MPHLVTLLKLRMGTAFQSLLPIRIGCPELLALFLLDDLVVEFASQNEAHFFLLGFISS